MSKASKLAHEQVYKALAKAKIGRCFIRRVYWQAPGVHQLAAWLREREDDTGPLIDKLDAKLPPPTSAGWLDDVLPAKVAQWLRTGWKPKCQGNGGTDNGNG